MSPALREESTRIQPISTGIVNSLSPRTDCVASGYVNDIPAKFLIDTGAAVTVISSQLWDKSKCESSKLLEFTGTQLVSVQGDPLRVLGIGTITATVGQARFKVKAVVAESLTMGVILGRDVLQTEYCTIEMGKEGSTLNFKKQGIAVNMNTEQAVLNSVSIVIEQSINIPPSCELEIMGSIPNHINTGVWIVENDTQSRPAAMVAKAIVKPQNGSIPIRLMNLREETIVVSKGSTIAKMELLHLTALWPVSVMVHQCLKQTKQSLKRS